MKLRSILAALLLTSCQATQRDMYKPHVPSTQIEAGSVSIAPYPIIPWKEISSTLQPNFSVQNADAVLPLVLPRTSMSDYAYRTSTSAGVGINLGGASREKSSQTRAVENLETGDYEQATRTTENARNYASGDPPDVDTNASLPQGVAASVSAFDPGRDPSLAYRAAAALYQEIKLLNTYLSAKLNDREKVAYLFRVQVTLQPYARHQPIDVYSRLWIEGESCSHPSCDYSELEIIPILVAEGGERSSSGRLVEAVSQFEASLSGMVSGQGVAAGLEQLRSELDAIKGDEYNSLVSVAQTGRDELMIRFGASYSPVSKYEMRTRTYDVSFLVLAPKKRNPDGSYKQNPDIRSVEILESSTFRNAVTGERLQLLDRSYLNTLRADLRRRLDSRNIPDDTQAEFLKLVGEGEFDDALSLCQRPPPPGASCQSMAGLLSVYNLVKDHQRAVLPNSISIELPEWRRSLPPPQSAFAVDQVKGGTTVRITGSPDFKVTEDLTAVLVANEEPGDGLPRGSTAPPETVFLAQSIKLPAPGVLEMSFPSLSAIGVDPQKAPVSVILAFWDQYENIKVREARLDSDDLPLPRTTLRQLLFESASGRKYPVVYDRKNTEPAAEVQAFKVVRIPDAPVADKDGKAKFRVAISSTKKLAAPVTVQVTLGSAILEKASRKGSTLEDASKALPGSTGLTVREEINRLSGYLDNVYEIEVSGVKAGADLTLTVSLLDASGKPIKAQTEEIKFKVAS